MIKVEGIQKTYKMGEIDVRALDGVSLEIEEGEYVAIIGSSGSGKSTLMHILGLLDIPDSGRFEIDGTDVTKFSDTELASLRNRVMGFVFQQFNLLRRTSALENVGLPLIYSRNGKKPGAAQKMLEIVGLADRVTHHPNELSGGQQQRVAIARALVNDPSIILADEPTGNLDSKSAREIMEVISELHARGLTILLVTHDAEVAKHAHRIIEIKDGKILADFENPDAPEVPAVETPVREEKATRFKVLHIFREGWILIRQSVRSLLANKVRTFLSALGIMIGVAAVISTIAMANGAKLEVETQLSRLGSNMLTLYPQRRSRGGVSRGSASGSRLSEKDADAIRKEVNHILNVSSTVDTSQQIKAGNKNWNCRVSGVDPEYEVMRFYTPDIGRFFTKDEAKRRARVALIGRTTALELFGEENPVGKDVKINGQNFNIIGLLPEKGSSGWRDSDDTLIIPLQTAMYRLFGREYVERIDIQVDSADNMERVQTDILELMTKRKRTGTQENPFRIRNLAEIQDTMAATSNTFGILLSSIATIALIVGGIGIMNIMLVSVTERTREIGLRKALGARRKDIMLQFLIEALIICFFGGCAGAAIGAGASILMNDIAGWNTLVSQESILLAFVFSAVIGIVFGIWPARKAASLNPIDALRYE